MTTRRGAAAVVALGMLLPVATSGGLIALAVLDTDPCSTSTRAVAPRDLPSGPVAGYAGEQLANAAAIMRAAADLGLSARDAAIGVMTAMGESSLRVLDHGDTAGPDSRGLFQQRDNGAWGTLADRMDPFRSASMFFRALSGIDSRDGLEPTIAAHRVQRNSNPTHYARWWSAAVEVTAALSGVTAPAVDGHAGAARTYQLGPVRPQTAAVAEAVGSRFGVRTIGGWRDPATEVHDLNGHPAGLALDFMTDDLPPGTGDSIAEYLRQNAAQLGVLYVIWQQRIWSVERDAEGWRPMRDRGTPTANHLDHVHVSLTGLGQTPEGQCPTDRAATTVSAEGWALPAAPPITSRYGPRRPPTGRGSAFHAGIDFNGAGCGGPIFAARAGRVIEVRSGGWAGTRVMIDHGAGLTTLYAHMWAQDVTARPGDQVAAGQQIALVGSAGNSTGCHLHFEIHRDRDAIDPYPILRAGGVL